MGKGSVDTALTTIGGVNGFVGVDPIPALVVLLLEVLVVVVLGVRGSVGMVDVDVNVVVVEGARP